MNCRQPDYAADDDEATFGPFPTAFAYPPRRIGKRRPTLSSSISNDSPTVTKQSHGSALLLILWVIILMSIMLSMMAFDAHIELRITSYYRKRARADAIARSGIEVARMLMQKRTTIDASGKVKEGVATTEDDPWLSPAQKLSANSPVNGLTTELGDGTLTIDIVPEPGRRNVNALSEDDWERVLEVGEIPVELWDELIDSVGDWIDRDDDLRPDGAEDEHYEALDPPRQIKNNPLDTVEELLLVKGFTRTILYGGVLEPAEDEDEEAGSIPGIVDLLTTYGDGKVNVNAAPRRVLMTLPEVDDYVADIIIEERTGGEEDAESDSAQPYESTSFKSSEDFFNRISEVAKSVKSEQISIDSAIYRVTCVGSVGGVNREVFAIVQYGDGILKILCWREQD